MPITNTDRHDGDACGHDTATLVLLGGFSSWPLAAGLLWIQLRPHGRNSDRMNESGMWERPPLGRYLTRGILAATIALCIRPGVGVGAGVGVGVGQEPGVGVEVGFGTALPQLQKP